MRLSGPRSRPSATHENLVEPEIEPGTSGTAARNSDHQTTDAVKSSYTQPIIYMQYILNKFHLSRFFQLYMRWKTISRATNAGATRAHKIRPATSTRVPHMLGSIYFFIPLRRTLQRTHFVRSCGLRPKMSWRAPVGTRTSGSKSIRDL
jgi:hypothetical protein